MPPAGAPGAVWFPLMVLFQDLDISETGDDNASCRCRFGADLPVIGDGVAANDRVTR